MASCMLSIMAASSLRLSAAVARTRLVRPEAAEMAQASPSKSWNCWSRISVGWSAMEAVETSRRAEIFCRTERARRSALIAAQATTSAIRIQPQGLNHTRMPATNARAMLMRTKNEKKRLRVTEPPASSRRLYLYLNRLVQPGQAERSWEFRNGTCPRAWF